MGFLAFLIFIIGCSAGIVLVYSRAHKLRSTDWDSLVAKIQQVPFRGLEIVAKDHLQPNGNQLKLEPGDMWALVGGMEGLRRMQNNADLIIALAAYVRLWNFEEAIIVSERIRHDSMILRRALFRIRIQMMFSPRRLRVPFYLHQAASSYYLMTKRLLALYETSQFVLYPRLAEAL
ncbi:MAG TPA: hypothetical protein VHT24_01155 [Pseudacidobacterium sp.]|jgi:hypothetical protein|nr:hypothetical protein [Pseudacidobacterium sp.]